MINDLKSDLRKATNPERAVFSKKFFKTGKGQYGFGDEFLGTSVPAQRRIAKNYQNLSFFDLQTLLNSKIHEERLTALFILVLKFKKADENGKEEIYKFYLKNLKSVNNWDLVDSSAPYIIGSFLLNRDRNIIYKLANSKNLWDKRIAMVSTHKFISNNETNDTFKIADILLNDKQDLIQKAVGWMLRELGKKVSEKELEEFLKPRYKKMPRTTLRYAIERFKKEKRIKYLTGTL